MGPQCSGLSEGGSGLLRGYLRPLRAFQKLTFGPFSGWLEPLSGQLRPLFDWLRPIGGILNPFKIEYHLAPSLSPRGCVMHVRDQNKVKWDKQKYLRPCSSFLQPLGASKPTIDHIYITSPQI